MKIYRIVKYLIIIITVIIVLYITLEISYVLSPDFITKVNHPKDRWLFNQIIFPSLATIYQKTGLTYKSLSEFNNSAFYPFASSSAASFDKKGQFINYRDESNAGAGRYIGYVIAGRKQTDITFHNVVRVSNRELMLRKMHWVCSDRGTQLSFIKSIRRDFIDAHFFHQPPKEDIEDKIVDGSPSALVNLGMLQAWLRSMYGSDVLTDAWGQPFLFSLSKNKVICKSAGEDKIWNTKDDIVSDDSGK